MRLVERSAPPSQADALRMLVNAVDRLAGARTTAEVVEILRSTARSLVGADGICIVLRDRGRCHYIEEDAISPLWKGGKFPMETCISGWAMLNRKTASVPDVFIDDRIPHAIYRETFVKSLVMTPIGRDEPTAALGAYWAHHYFAPPEVIETLETLARAASTALENAYLISALSASLRKTELARDDLRHRFGNALAAIESYALTTLDALAARELSNRVKAMTRAHRLADETFAIDGSVRLADVVAAEIEPYRKQSEAKIELSGGNVSVTGAQAIAVALMLNDLALHALRSGLMKSAGAALRVRWREEARSVRIDWEQAFPSASAANAAGNIGSGLVRNLVITQLHGNVRQVVDGASTTLMIEFGNEGDIAFPENRAVG
jgi:two-component sensor histidine kinase